MMTKQKYYFECTDCGRQFHDTDFMYLCPECSSQNTKDIPPYGVLKMKYPGIQEQKNKSALFKVLKNEQYLSLLPLEQIESLGNLPAGNTPLLKIEKPDGESHPFTILAKDDSRNPTFSFKDRASVLVSAFAREHGISTIIAASTGNAGSSLAGICAANDQKAIIFVPAAAPKAKLTQILMYGAKIVPVNGTYDQAFDLSLKATEKFGYFNRNTAFNPLTIEGKKTVAFEIFDQMGEDIPDKIFVPVGDGVIISGVYKGFEDLLGLGIIKQMPVIVAVQAEGSSNIILNLDTESFRSTPSKTIADSISVDIPRNFRMTRQYIQKYAGETISVSDKEILEASLACSRNTGIFAEPAAATAYAGMLKYITNNKITAGERVVVLLTGSGLKDLSAVQPMINMPAAVSPDADLTTEML